MKAFVGVKKELLSIADLLKLIEELATESSFYFLRWTHKVSNDWQQKPKETDFPMLEGQMFNSQFELRWKKKCQNSYKVLLLSLTSDYPDFVPVGSNWHVQDQNVHLHPPTETRFPKQFSAQGLNIAQRYFINKQTSTVHFVALTIKE
jgi:hypothetical protein